MPTPILIHTSNNTHADTSLVGWTSPPSGRGSLGIIWSCLATLSLVSWSALCVNIPKPKSSLLHPWRRKGFLTFCCLLGPEYTFLVALGQYIAGKETFNAFKKHPRWSMRHSFCAEMGFWVAETKDGVRFPLNGRAVVFLMEEGHVSAEDMQQKVLVDEQFIKDRNKADTLLRVLALAQGTWFAINSLARFAQHLPHTTLELTGLAFFIPNLGTFFFWRYERCDVETSVLLRLDKTVSEIQEQALRGGRYPDALEPWY